MNSPLRSIVRSAAAAVPGGPALLATRRRRALRQRPAPLAVLRRARPTDVDAIKAISRRTWDGRDYLAAEIDRWMIDPANLVTVAELAGSVVAVIRAQCRGSGEWWLDGLRVDPEVRNQGLGKLLFRHTLDLVDGAQFSEGFPGRATAMIQDENVPILRTVRQTGFTEVARTALCTATPDPCRSAEALKAFTLLGVADLARAQAFTRDAAEYPALVRGTTAHPVVDPLTPVQLTELLQSGHVYLWSRPGCGEGMTVVSTDQSVHADHTALNVWYVTARSSLTSLAADLRGLAALSGVGELAQHAQATPETVSAFLSAGWERPRGLRQSVLFTRPLGSPHKPTAPPDPEIEREQARLNELLAPLGFQPLVVDGWLGPRTRQALGAARLLHEYRHASHARPVARGRWAVVDLRFQLLIAGDTGGPVRFVVPVSTGAYGTTTRETQSQAAFRFEPALGTGGWHNSSEHPVPATHRFPGNMYRPIYFDDGTAVHGSDRVPPFPASYGCVRTTTDAQDMLVTWLGLDDATETVWEPQRIDLSVTVQGEFPSSR